MNLYDHLTDRILKQLEAGTLPWRKTWKTAMPKSLSSQKEYRGVNVLLLGAKDYESRYWVTYREAQRLGGHVRQGERATPVIYWKWRTPEELARRAQQLGQERIAPCVPFTSAVFNLDQVEGIQRPEDDIPASRNQRLTAADQVYAVMPHKPEIVHTRASGPSYSPTEDRITMPHLGQFENADEYYATLFHEMVHATGHRERLGRFSDGTGDPAERYSFEELVAEFGAAFLCAFAGIRNATSDALQASYIDGWWQALRKEPQWIVRAASAAQRAADYVRGKVRVADPPAEG